MPDAKWATVPIHSVQFKPKYDQITDSSPKSLLPKCNRLGNR